MEHYFCITFATSTVGAVLVVVVVMVVVVVVAVAVVGWLVGWLKAFKSVIVTRKSAWFNNRYG